MKHVKILLLFLIGFHTYTRAQHFEPYSSETFQGVFYGDCAVINTNNDSYTDFIFSGAVTGYGSGHTEMYLSNSSGIVSLENEFSMIMYSAIAVGDLNGDGFEDFAITGVKNQPGESQQQVFEIYYNNGDNSFTKDDQTGIFPTSFGSVKIADLNGDGITDIFVNGISGTTYISKIYFQDINGNFIESTNSLTGTYFSASEVFDANGDGLPDIIVTGFDTSYAPSAALYLNQGSGIFEEYSVGIMGVYFSSISVADFNNDGTMDLLISGMDTSYSASLILYQNDGNGNFTPEYSFSGTYSGASALVDYNNDGLIDVFSIGSNANNQNTVLFYQNDGNGNFNIDPLNIDTIEGLNMSKAKWFDFDNDGDMDLLTIGFSGTEGKTTLYVNIIGSLTCDNSEPGQNTGDTGCVSFVYNGETVQYTTVRAEDGQVWLQQNLGSENIAVSATDPEAFGDLFQWGRWDDGHQKRDSETSTSLVNPNNPTGLNGGSPYFYITTPEWWKNGNTTDQWEAQIPANVTETNGCDPCKAIGEEWRLPTPEEWQAVVNAEEITNIQTAFDSNLKLTVAGARGTSGVYNDGVRGYYWSKTPSDNSDFAKYLYYSNFIVNTSAGGFREQGSSVRCLKVSQTTEITSLDVMIQDNAPATITEEEGTLQLVVIANPSEANQDVIWSVVLGSEFASVNENGLVTAITNGTVTVRATSGEDDTVFGEIDVVISNQGNENNFPTPYCDITDNYDVEPITYVSFADIENPSESESDVILENFTSISTEVTKNATYTLTVEGNTVGNFVNYIMAYIDWDQNDVFDASELYLIGTIEDSDGEDGVFASLDILIPSDAELGATRMRIIKSYDDESYQTDCGSIDYGQAEDYTIIVVNVSNVPVTDLVVTTLNGVASEITQNFGTLQLLATVNPVDASQLVNWSVTLGETIASVNAQGVVSANGSGNGEVTVRATSVADDSLYDDIVITVSNQVGITEYCDVTVDYEVLPITLVNFSDLNNPTSAVVNGTPAYEDFTAMIANVEQGATYTLTIEGNTDGNFIHDIRVFIDWNKDFVFDMNTEYYHVSLLPSTGEDGIETTVEITIPQNAVLGNTRMRIIKDHWNIYEEGEFDACTDAYHGQVEDYSVNVFQVNPVVVESVTVTTENDVPATITTQNVTLQLVAMVNPSEVNQDVTWLVISGGEFTSVDEAGLVTAITNGTATIRATSVEDETVYGEIEVLVEIGLSTDDFYKNNINLYPNPVTAFIQIETSETIKEVVLINALGQQIWKGSNSRIDFSDYSTGIYIIKVTLENNVISTHKVIKQ